jgi:mRNA interferase HigB
VGEIQWHGPRTLRAAAGTKSSVSHIDVFFAKCEAVATHVISKLRLAEFWQAHPDAEQPLRAWHQVADAASWQSLNDVRATYPQADLVERLTVFNIGGNKYRLIARVEYERQELYIRQVLTQVGYDREDWKRDPWYRRS